MCEDPSLLTPRGSARRYARPPDLCDQRMTDHDVTEDPAPADLLALLDDEVTRCVLLATSEGPRSAAELSDRCGVSQSTIYRRLDRLREADLLGESTRPKPEGHHETVYVATLAAVEVRLADGDLELTVERREEDVADSLTRLWENF